MSLPGSWGAALARGVDDLEAAGVPGARRDARLLLAAALEMPPDRLTVILHDPAEGAAAARFMALIARRAERQPVAQLVGGRWFFGRWFRVTPDVLDPRPETEALVRLALAGRFERVVDLGTGSGAILLSLLADRPQASGLGTDISPPALAVARANAAALDVAARARFLQADWWQGVTGRFDLVVANPPYIAGHEIAGLDADVRDWEPRAALDGGADGLDAYRAIAAGVAAHLGPGGRVLAEIGPTQGPAVTELFRAAGLDPVTVHPDLDRRDRVVCARKAA